MGKSAKNIYMMWILAFDYLIIGLLFWLTFTSIFFWFHCASNLNWIKHNFIPQFDYSFAFLLSFLNLRRSNQKTQTTEQKTEQTKAATTTMAISMTTIIDFGFLVYEQWWWLVNKLNYSNFNCCNRKAMPLKWIYWKRTVRRCVFRPLGFLVFKPIDCRFGSVDVCVCV